MTPETIAQLTGTTLAVAVLVYMCQYFMRRDEQREKFVITVIQENTQAIVGLQNLIRDLKSQLGGEHDHHSRGRNYERD